MNGQGYKASDIPWNRIRPYVPWAVGLAVVVWVLSTTLYQVDADSEAVVLRFGRVVRTAGPGLHVRFPFGIDTVRQVPVKRVETLEFGFHTLRAGQRTTYEPRGKEHLAVSLMLTGDLNAAVVEWIVQYRIKEPEDYLFRVKDVRETIRVASEAMMRRLVGDRSVDEVITFGREEIADEMKRSLQALLETYRCGVEVVAVKLQDATPPELVKDAFDAVNRAKQEQDRVKNEAEAERNQLIPEARGEKARKVLEATGYAARIEAEAKGRSDAFLAKWNAYRQAPEATHQRLYIEAMESALKRAGSKVIVDEQLKGLVPLLDLGRKGGAR